MVEMDPMKPNFSTTENPMNCFQGGKKFLIFFQWLAQYFTKKKKTNPHQTSGEPQPRKMFGKGGSSSHTSWQQDLGEHWFRGDIPTPLLFVLLGSCVLPVPAGLTGSLRCCLYTQGHIHSYDNSIHTLTVFLFFDSSFF